MKKIIKIFAVSAIVACSCSFFTLQSKQTIVKENVEALTQDADVYNDVEVFYMRIKAFQISEYSCLVLPTQIEEYGNLCSYDPARSDQQVGYCLEIQVRPED